MAYSMIYLICTIKHVQLNLVPYMYTAEFQFQW
nr:MAG TPA: hypothetical protein [Caudoviricetes sp.]